MSQISRRSFLKLLPTLPFFKMTWPELGFSSINLTESRNSGAPNILFIVFDTLSARHTFLYDYNRETTPNLARLADRATVFHGHYSAANFTSPATASILTGTYPWSHRAFHLHSTARNTYADKNLFSLLPDAYYKVAYTHNLLVTSLLHQFRGNLDLLKQTRELCLADGQLADLAFFEDYSPAFWGESNALRSGATPPGTLFLSLLDRGLRYATKSRLTQLFGDLYPRGIPNLHNLFFLLEDAIDWIHEQVISMPQPFLAYFHLLPPHEPYTTRRDFVDVFRDGWEPIVKEVQFGSEGHPQDFLNRQRREYDEYLAFTDAEFGRLYAQLERSGALDNTYLIVMSDHGELFERGVRGHVTPTLYEPLLHIPLLIAKPGQQRRVDVFERTSNVDLLPTLLHLTGQPRPEWCEGEILPTFSDGSPNSERAVYAVEAKSNPKNAPLTKATMVLLKDQFKLIHYFGYRDREEMYELYDLQADPEELDNLYTPDNATAADLQQELTEKRQQVNEPYLR